jgi:hypothetical protein
MGVIENAKEVAELIKKYNDVELNRRIVNLEIEVAELQRDKIRLEAKVAEQQAKLQQKQAMQFRVPYYWQDGDKVPFCPKCWEASGLGIHLTEPYRMASGIGRKCVQCEEIYWEQRISMSSMNDFR